MVRAVALIVLFAFPALAQTPPPPKPKSNAAAPAKKPSGKTEVTWHGHAAFTVVTPSGKTVYIDPWLENPSNPAGKNAVAQAPKADLILVTHGHSDHVGNAVDLGKKSGAPLVATFDLGNALKKAGYPEKQAEMMTLGNTGGTVRALDGEVEITFVPAVHSSSVSVGNDVVEAGNPGGFRIAIKNGPALYHTGDTDVFGDMARIGKVDVMLACIGDHFTMGPERAAEAVRLVKAKTVIPMHYGTFPLLTGTPAALEKALKGDAKVVALKPGQTASF